MIPEVHSVRRVGPGDAERLRAIRLRALRTDPTAFESVLEEEERQSLPEWDAWAAASSDGPDRSMYFAQADDEVIGLVGAYRSEAAASEMMLISMWVDPQWRRRGVGRSLIATVVHWATGSDTDRLVLWVVDGHEPAMAAYGSAGFVATGESKFVRGDTARRERKFSLTLVSKVAPE